MNFLLSSLFIIGKYFSIYFAKNVLFIGFGVSDTLLTKLLRIILSTVSWLKLSPLKVLARGYAAVYSGGKIIDSVEKADVKKNITVRLVDGEIECKPLEKRVLTER